MRNKVCVLVLGLLLHVICGGMLKEKKSIISEIDKVFVERQDNELEKKTCCCKLKSKCFYDGCMTHGPCGFSCCCSLYGASCCNKKCWQVPILGLCCAPFLCFLYKLYGEFKNKDNRNSRPEAESDDLCPVKKTISAGLDACVESETGNNKQ